MLELKRYAGVGSRETPQLVLDLMRLEAARRAKQGWVLRSGGARGADTAFFIGATFAGGQCEIFRALDATPESLALAASVHPAWSRCSDYARRLHARNCQIILGRDLDTPVSECLFWTPGGEAVGGTGQALRLCKLRGIPTIWLH